MQITGDLAPYLAQQAFPKLERAYYKRLLLAVIPSRPAIDLNLSSSLGPF